MDGTKVLGDKDTKKNPDECVRAVEEAIFEKSIAMFYEKDE